MTVAAPNPGSPAAVDAGCECPVMDNGRGRGYMGGVKDKNGDTVFVIVAGCPLHSPAYELLTGFDEDPR